jgi:Sec-independent protein translocase protein TatA
MDANAGLMATIISGIVVISLVYIVLLGNSKKNVGNLGQEVNSATSNYGKVVKTFSGQ